ncbi:MAG TPA: disulfide bond formation protein B [Rhodocyclaceae bacterium]
MTLTSRQSFALLAAAGIGCFFGGVVAGNLFHLAACPLCILQRMLYLSFGVLGLIGVALANKPLAARLMSALLLLAAGTGAFIAAYQSWIQHHPEGPSCTADAPWWETFVYWAGEQLPTFFLSSGMCTDPGFKLFGLSIAEYSLMVFSALALASVALLLKKRA